MILVLIITEEGILRNVGRRRHLINFCASPKILPLFKTSHIGEMVPINFKGYITDTGQLTRPHLYDYAHPISHTEETEALLTQSKIRLEPSQFRKESDSGNFEYLVG